jgi:glycogen operon protein
VGHRWAEWNGQFRDDARRFIKGDEDTVRRVAARVVGSPDLYPQPDREPNRSINFVTCHDGFTLNDLVSYNRKHNGANLEFNRDGHDTNHSWNCGVEGPTLDPEVQALRRRQVRNFFTLLFTAQGTPMLQMGDEVRRTQRGNNNAYCQDNEVSWFDWGRVDRYRGLLRFVRWLVKFTQSLAIFREEQFLTTDGGDGDPSLTWHGVALHRPDWTATSHTLAYELRHPEAGEHLHVMLNAYWHARTFALPPLPQGQRWHRIVDTARASPDDFCPPHAAPAVAGNTYRVTSRSAVVLMAGGGGA